MAPLRPQGIRVATYLDDWLLLTQLEQEARAHRHILIRHLCDLGFVINAEKSMMRMRLSWLCFAVRRIASLPVTLCVHCDISCSSRTT